MIRKEGQIVSPTLARDGNKKRDSKGNGGENRRRQIQTVGANRKTQLNCHTSMLMSLGVVFSPKQETTNAIFFFYPLFSNIEVRHLSCVYRLAPKVFSFSAIFPPTTLKKVSFIVSIAGLSWGHNLPFLSNHSVDVTVIRFGRFHRH